MYIASELKQDMIINMKSDNSISEELINSLRYSKFEYEDTGVFTRRVWNTYQRILKIYCRPKDKDILIKHSDEIYKYADNIHGVQDEYMIMNINVYAKASLESKPENKDAIVITKSIIIDKNKDYIKSGGFGSIYKIEENTGDVFAYKIFDPSPYHSSDKDIMKKRFIREGKKLLDYCHDNIVKVYETGKSNEDTMYIKMQYIKGDNLYDFIKKSSITVKEKYSIMNQFISAIAYVHKKGDMHRDFSYSNVMITEDKIVKVIDFGFSKNPLKDTVYDTKMSPVSQRFDPPEDEYDFRSEVYCIGAILYTIFVEESFHSDKLDKLEIIKMDEKFKNAIKKCLNISPDMRYQTAYELYESLYISQSLKEQEVHKLSDNTIPAINLDTLKSELQNSNTLYFSMDSLPTIETIKKWIEVGFYEYIEESKYFENNHAKDLLFKILGVSKIDYDINCTSKELLACIREIYNYYINIKKNNEKIYFLKAILRIVLEISEEELPF